MAQEPALNNITQETCFVPATHEGKGRRTAVAPGATAARYLHYGRITLGVGDAPVSFANNDHETGLICLDGSATVSTNGQSFELDRYDSVYIPRDSQIEVKPNGPQGCDLAEVSAPVSQRYPVKFVSYKEVRQNPKLHLIAGKPPAERDLNWLASPSQHREIGLPGRRTNTRTCWKRLISSSTCLRLLLACNSFTQIRTHRSSYRLCVRAIVC